MISSSNTAVKYTKHTIPIIKKQRFDECIAEETEDSRQLSEQAVLLENEEQFEGAGSRKENGGIKAESACDGENIKQNNQGPVSKGVRIMQYEHNARSQHCSTCIYRP